MDNHISQRDPPVAQPAFDPVLSFPQRRALLVLLLFPVNRRRQGCCPACSWSTESLQCVLPY